MRLCHIVPSLEDRHGGPSKSVRALANSLAALGESVELLATAEARWPAMLAGRDAAVIRLFPRIAPRWLSRSPELRAHLRQAEFDCVHHHSLWLLTLRYAREAARRRDVPLVISPRGMMSGWAYSHRRWRKALAERFVHPGAFAAAAGWHATSPEEADDIRALGFRQPVCVSPNGVDLPADMELAAARSAWLDLCPAARTRPVALFYSRFHRKKRLEELIDLWLSAPR
ncbi:MAG: glycosyltransferase, partial [Opitutae bacterium]|nr:glycosyltransferase [Opitutae bacterium]